jgi:hypothetical protein
MSETEKKSDEKSEYGGNEEKDTKQGADPENSLPSEAYSYLNDGRMIYTDPTSKIEYILDATGTQWVKK